MNVETSYNTENLNRWTLPDYYSGAEWSEYFVFLGRHRDSDLVTESNFECGLREIGGESDTVRVVREGHWAVGWIEWIAIHESDARALEIADDIAGALREYPVVDESDWSEREWNAIHEYWESENIRGRVQILREAGANIFAARRDTLPDCDAVFERVRELVQ